MTDYGSDLAQQGSSLIFSQKNDMFSSAGKCLHFCTETPASTDKKSGIPNIQRIPVYFVKIVLKLKEYCKTCRKYASAW